jgi:hypothetical protein
MTIRLLAAFLAAIALGACGVDSTPQSTGASGATSQQSEAPRADAEKSNEGEKKAQ